MRLLDTTTLELMSFQGWNVPGYAILSHVWETEEATFQDISNFNNIKDMHGYAKIVGACDTARRNGIGYIWIDTCCINKESSAELSEAINSMYKWYSGAQVCYAYLSDVPSTGDHGDRSLFAMSHWFTRGWTLQELIAPRKVVFYARDWVDIGTKTTLQDTISSVTGINPEIIVGRTLLESVPIAVRMSWAAGRNTTREEDIAYSLMGLFDVNMPLLYGEGRKAFIRLQLEIIKKNSDHSIFAWKEDLLSSMSGGLHGLLARSPAKFRGLGNVERILDPASGDEQPGHVSIGETLPYNITNRGLFIKLPTTEISEGETHKTLAFLNCRFSGISEPIVIPLQKPYTPRTNVYFRSEVATLRGASRNTLRLAKMTSLYIATDPPLRDHSVRESRFVRYVVNVPLHYKPEIKAIGCDDECGVWDTDGRIIFEKHDEADEVVLMFEDYDEFGKFAVTSGREGPLWVNILSADKLEDEGEWEILESYLPSPNRSGIQWTKQNRFLDRASVNLNNGWSVTVNTFDHDIITDGIRIDLVKTPSVNHHLSNPMEQSGIRNILPPIFTKIFGKPSE